jgi:DNA-binding NarL/FixJ family response regulator
VINERTVKNHVKNILVKLHSQSTPGGGVQRGQRMASWLRQLRGQAIDIAHFSGRG